VFTVDVLDARRDALLAIPLGLIPAVIDDPVGRILHHIVDRSRATVLQNHDRDPGQPTRSAITKAGIVGNSASSRRTWTSNASNADEREDPQPYPRRRRFSAARP
jgi:hypothetical protein